MIDDSLRAVSVAAGANFSEITSGVRDLIVTKGENTRWMSDDHFRMKVLPQMEDNVDCMRPDKIKLFGGRIKFTADKLQWWAAKGAVPVTLLGTLAVLQGLGPDFLRTPGNLGFNWAETLGFFLIASAVVVMDRAGSHIDAARNNLVSCARGDFLQMILGSMDAIINRELDASQLLPS